MLSVWPHCKRCNMLASLWNYLIQIPQTSYWNNRELSKCFLGEYSPTYSGRQSSMPCWAAKLLLVAILADLVVPRLCCGHSSDGRVDTDLAHCLWSARRVTGYFCHSRQLVWFNPQRAVTEEEGAILMSSGWNRTSYQFPAPVPCTDVRDVSLHFCCNFSRRKAFVLKSKHPV